MVEYEFSLLENTEAAIRSMQAAFDAYNAHAQSHQFSLYTISWGDAWSQSIRAALYKKGPVGSEVGATFTGDLVHMNSLRPFSDAEVQRAGGQAAFFPIAWRSGLVADRKEVWGLPLRLDARVVWYWRDLLEQAGIDEASAFDTPEHFHETMQKLQASGIEYPLHTFSNASRNTVYHLASWLWQRGGEFIDGDGKVAFHHPQAMQGITDYFRLFPFINPARPHSFFSFAERKAAAVIENPGVLAGLQDSGLLPAETLARLGVAALPGPSFVGGTDLVIWQHAPYEAAQAASAFIAGFLASDTYLDFAYNAHYLPALQSAVRDPRWADPRYQMMFDIAQQGRSHYGSHLWVMLADRMAAMAEKTFNELFAAPAMTQAEVAALVSARVENLAARLENAIH